MSINKIYTFILLVCLTGSVSSCWDDFSEMYYDSADLSSFYFAQQDTCEDIENYTFYINQVNGTVYNLDSLPYGSKTDYLLPTFTFYTSNGDFYVGDSLWESGDTLDFSSPVIFKNTSEGGDVTRTYTIYVNVHQVDPDSVLVRDFPATLPGISIKNKAFLLSDSYFRVYFENPSTGLSVYKSDSAVTTWTALSVAGLPEKMNVASICQLGSAWYITSQNGQLYTSSDGLSWNATGDGTKIKTLFGVIKKKYVPSKVAPQYLIGLAENNLGGLVSTRSTDGMNWEIGSTIDEDFPVSDYGVALHNSVTNVQSLTVATGLRADATNSSSVWSTEDGLNWVLINSDNTWPISTLQGCNLFYYDNYLVCFGGVNKQGHYTDVVYLSKDQGKNWKANTDLWLFPAITKGQAYGSMVVQEVEDLVNDKNREFMWYFGGQTDGQISVSVWKAFEHQMLFKRR